MIVYKSISKLVTPDPRLQGCIVLYNRTDDSAGESSLLWVCPIGAFTSLCSDSECGIFIFPLTCSIVCPETFTIFSLKFFVVVYAGCCYTQSRITTCIRGLLYKTVAYNTRVAL